MRTPSSATPAASWVVTGSGGQLGTALVARLERAGIPVRSADLEVDIADPEAVARFLDAPPRPTVVANAAAYTHVDRCEREPDTADRVNREGPAVLARACRKLGARLVHVSTDYVFPGDGSRPYAETDPTGPRSCYGRTKLAGERAVLDTCEDALVLRTSWVFGRGRNFLAAILAQARERRSGTATGPLRVVDDQRGRPTYAVDLAEALERLVEAGAQGLYHVANAGEATWWDLARFCLDEAGFADLGVERIRTRDLDLDADRPAYSVLDCSKAEALGLGLRPWREAVRAYLHSADSPLAKPAGGTP
jgi:dTDP-4-dehydrorhamnose reductase